MSTSRMGHRVAAVVLAVLFLVTSLGFSGLVVWEMHQESRRNKQASSATDSTPNNETNQESKEGMLEGTQLADFTPVTGVNEVQVIDITEGTGEAVKIGDTITAHYTGALAATGVIFQSSHDAGQTFTAALEQNQLIEGWIEGIPGMKAGGKRRIIIPAEKAYGSNEQSGIPANSDLVFDVELEKIN